MASFTVKDHLPSAAPAQQVSAFAPSSSSSSAPQLVEDESRKKNTDCVYFLASPLTCKKGSECEYRHSEYARVNPRDCYYWLNGKCLNPKCSFRHPPLDTLLGTPGDSSAGGSSMPASSSSTAGSSLAPPHAVPLAPYVAAKSTAPCIFFQQGYCLKGDRCPFSHGPNFAGNKAPEFPAANVSEFSRFNTASGGLAKCSQIKTAPRANVSKPVESVPSQPRPNVHILKAVPTNGAFADKRGVPQPNFSNEGLPKHNEMTSRPLNNGISKSVSGIVSQPITREDQRLQSGKEADDLTRETSPGFDVLVDDELRDDNYYGNDDQFPIIRGHDGRDHSEFETNRRDRYKSLDDVDPAKYHDRHGYDRYKPTQRHGRDSSEKSIMDGSNYDRRGAYKGVNPDGASGDSDLRQRLSKQRRTNGQNSVAKADNLAEEHRYRSSRRDSRHSPPRGSSISSRLQGRIKIPGQASVVHPPASIHSEREYDKGRSHSRLSPTRSQSQSHRGRLQDRLRGRVQDDVSRDIPPGRDALDYNSSNFSAPKSLAELRKAKQPHSQSRELPKRSEEFASVGKRRALESSQHSEEDISFEAPKPLSEILKRKRKAGDNEEAGKSTMNKENAAVEKQAVNEEEENKLKEEAPLAPSKETNLPAEESDAQNLDSDNKISQENDVFEAEEEGLITEGVEGQEFEEEYYEEGEAVYEDEQEGGGGEEGYNLEEGENGELPDDDYMEEDDEDNFAKKIGVMFS